MADLIERKKVLEILRIIGNGRPISGKRAISLISEMPSASMWIPCSERLPGRFDTVLLAILSKNGYGEPAYYVTIGGMKNGTEFESYTGEMAEGEKVTHWMPLPNEPEVTKDDNG